ncbi:hypothetical protein AC1031_013139 [Aphanomyces cochlioides]|nr:hypothetical protein AC1031_013139 [Aphanomyces cochlioides]
MAGSKWKESSDLVARFKEMYTANPKASNVSYEGITLPTAVTSRLAANGLAFDNLPNLMRQALLWDMGLVVGHVNGDDTLMQVYVSVNGSMSNIMLPWNDYIKSTAGADPVTLVPKEQTTCTFGGVAYNRQKVMDGLALMKMLKCAVSLVGIDGQSTLIAQDALPPTVVPQPRLYKHQDTTQGWTLLGIHLLPTSSSAASGEAAWGECPVDASHEALIIPCEVKDYLSTSTNKYIPSYSSAMDSWLAEFKAANPNLTIKPSTTSISPTPVPTSTPNTSNVGLIVSVACGAVALLGLLLLWLLRRRRKQPLAYENTPEDGYAPATTQKHQGTGTFGTSSSQYGRHTGSEGISLASISLYRLQNEDVKIERLIGSGAYANVLLGSYKGRDIAVKQLLPGRASLVEVQALVDEIVLLAGFSSPYIIEFVGAMWDKPIDLACVLEYMDLGDLRHYLSHRPSSDYSWSEKVECIYNIVEGLVYLHSFPIIHRDLKSRNVLLDTRKGTKLTDFGVSREQTQETMTNGVGTYRWMAPEILKYNHYTVAADMYSFGMILSEFATHEIPYADRVNPYDGKPLIDTAIMAMVVSNEIQPTFTDDMPAFLKDIALQCISHDPSKRPTSMVLSSRIRKHMTMTF